MQARAKYAIAGALLGLGAPAGAILLRLTLPAVRDDPLGEIALHSFFYLYSLFGSMVVLAFTGYIAGREADRLRNAEFFYQRLAEHDPATGLLNVRGFMQHYERAVERACRTRQPMALILLDVDRLKRINDLHGHAHGTAALQHVASAIHTTKRRSDQAARWGGDEFAVLLEVADVLAARRTADAILLWLRQNPLEGRRIGVTIGIAAGVPDTPATDFFALADGALYAGKKGGRDQVRTVDLPSEQAVGESCRLEIRAGGEDGSGPRAPSPGTPGAGRGRGRIEP